jgi:hypothetical protein
VPAAGAAPVLTVPAAVPVRAALEPTLRSVVALGVLAVAADDTPGVSVLVPIASASAQANSS